MKKLSNAALAALLLALPAVAQDDLVAKYEKKMAKEFVKKTTWESTLADAQAKAATSNKLIFAYFTRSYSP